MFLVYKPKGGRIKAAKITLETLEEAVAFFRGRVTRGPVALSSDFAGPKETTEQTQLGPITGFEYPTFVGLVQCNLGDYMVGNEVGGYKKVDGKEFEETYEPARVVNREPKS